MQPLSHVPDQRGSLTSRSSKSPETLPPSPVSSQDKPSSNISKAITLLKDRRAGTTDESWNTIKLRSGEYDKLWQQLGDEDEELLKYVENKISIDYDPGTLEFVVRMPTEVHEYLGRSIEATIYDQLCKIKSSNDPAATLARNIHNYGSASVFLEDGARRDPDGQFKYQGAEYSSLIIEVANSTSKKGGGKDLHRLADQYITESSGSINTVIGISLDYQGTKRATLSIWHPSYGLDQEGEYLAADEVVMSQEFRKADGTLVTQHTLHLPLNYFLPLSDLPPPVAGEHEIVIPYDELAEYLDQAEATVQLVRAKQGISKTLRAGMRKRKRKRESTPPEILNSADERRFEQEELLAERLANKEDED